jgi:cell shape-determining protein MreD
MEIVVVFLLIILAFLEGSLTSIPLVLMCLITIAAHTKSSRVYFYALLSGCVLDILTGRILGVTSLFFVILLSMIFLYQKKYEINSHIFIFFASAVMALLYGLFFHVSHFFIQILISVLFAQSLFLLWNVLFLKENTASY